MTELDCFCMQQNMKSSWMFQGNFDSFESNASFLRELLRNREKLQTTESCQDDERNEPVNINRSVFIMVFTFYLLRICRNLKCAPPLKLSIVRYSSEAKPNVRKSLAQREQSSLSVAENYRVHQVSTSDSISPSLDKSIITDNVSSKSRKDARAKEEPEWRPMKFDAENLKKHCLMLSKIRLTSLVVITTMGGYALAPGPFDISTFIACSVGTGLVSATANSINQFFEVPFDAQMSRTKNRVLVRGHLTSAQAIIFATASGIGGLTLLYSEVNGLTATLGAANLILYTLIYTPMKRVSILNTWVGSIVGAIPPLMGWAGCVGDIMSPGAWIMSGLLYAWQFPHFNALSWNLRPDYSRAGYRMMAVTNPSLCRKTALRYTAALMGLCYLAPVLDVTNWWFAALSTPLNAYFLHLAWKFHQHSDSGSSRKLFRFSLVHLPTLMILMLVTKKHWFSENKKAGTVTLEENRRDVLSILSRFIASTPSSV